MKKLYAYKDKVIKYLGILFVCIGVLGLVFSSFGENITSQKKESNKTHLLCIGVDKFEIMSEREQVYNSIGQADGIFLITIDETKKTVDIVAVPRDTIVTIQKYYSNMEYMGEEEAQICLQYAYADGLENSCELMVDRIEELFEGVKIDNYVAINMASVIEINTVIGGVDVIVNNADTAQKMGVEVGESVHLNWENISLYLQSRDKAEAQSAYGRMERLKDYVKAFIPRALEEVKENPAIIGEVMTVLGANLVTDLDAVKTAALATALSDLSAENITYCTLEGEVIMGEDGYEEFYPDSAKLEKIIQQIK